MFNVTGGEFLVIAVLALVVLGPDRLPGAIRQAGQFMAEIRKVSNSFKVDLKSAMDDAEREADAELAAGGGGSTTGSVDPAARASDLLEGIRQRASGVGTSGSATDSGASVPSAEDDPVAVARAELAALEGGESTTPAGI